MKQNKLNYLLISQLIFGDKQNCCLFDGTLKDIHDLTPEARVWIG